jgi:hypothetical protein
VFREKRPACWEGSFSIAVRFKVLATRWRLLLVVQRFQDPPVFQEGGQGLLYAPLNGDPSSASRLFLNRLII